MIKYYDDKVRFSKFEKGVIGVVIAAIIFGAGTCVYGFNKLHQCNEMMYEINALQSELNNSITIQEVR